eukprot:GILI01037666.1.p1 GENE.GILI01037666.1~~GILI01037666.1.p1  ORF type:complete len:123 (-),score=10.94 GILI01037666.1:26-394(-)
MQDMKKKKNPEMIDPEWKKRTSDSDASEQAQRLFVDILDLQVLTCLAVGGPESQVITQELHDEGRVLVRSLIQVIESLDSLVKSRFGQLASSLGVLQNLVVANGVVQSQTKADGVGGRAAEC